MLHQIVNGAQYSGAGGRVFERFYAQVVRPLRGNAATHRHSPLRRIKPLPIIPSQANNTWN